MITLRWILCLIFISFFSLFPVRAVDLAGKGLTRLHNTQHFALASTVDLSRNRLNSLEGVQHFLSAETLILDANEGLPLPELQQRIAGHLKAKERRRNGGGGERGGGGGERRREEEEEEEEEEEAKKERVELWEIVEIRGFAR